MRLKFERLVDTLSAEESTIIQAMNKNDSYIDKYCRGDSKIKASVCLAEYKKQVGSTLLIELEHVQSLKRFIASPIFNTAMAREFALSIKSKREDVYASGHLETLVLHNLLPSFKDAIRIVMKDLQFCDSTSLSFKEFVAIPKCREAKEINSRLVDYEHSSRGHFIALSNGDGVISVGNFNELLTIISLANGGFIYSPSIVPVPTVWHLIDAIGHDTTHYHRYMDARVALLGNTDIRQHEDNVSLRETISLLELRASAVATTLVSIQAELTEYRLEVQGRFYDVETKFSHTIIIAAIFILLIVGFAAIFANKFN